VEWVRAGTAAEAADAIRSMVTQSSGPFFVTCAALELEALRLVGLPLDAARTSLAAAGALLAGARPTNTHARHAVDEVLHATSAARTAAELVDAAVAAARGAADRYRALSRALAGHTADLVPDGARVLTHCWMDSYLLELLHVLGERGMHYDWVVTETRPYLQGARLTAHSLAEAGESVTLITDGMAAAALAPDSALGGVDALVTAADRVPLDGSVVNKVGTLQLAIAAHHFGVPFHALVQRPDATAPTAADIVIEERDPDEVLAIRGHRTASGLVTRAWYPAFDVTPPALVTTIVTSEGPVAPAEVAARFGGARAASDAPEAPEALAGDEGTEA
jgi:methylthioribose-1-phosphate isomerase